MHSAAAEGHVDVVEVLLKARANANIEATDKDGLIPLHYAARNGHTPVVAWLVKAVPETQPKNVHDSSKQSIEPTTKIIYKQSINQPETQPKKVVHSGNFGDVSKERPWSNLFIGVIQIALGMVDIEKSPFAGGAFGEVYQGSWGNRPVALKKIDVEYAQKKLGLGVAKDDILESLGWEIARLSTVSHPNLVQFHGIYQHKREDYTYLVMEFCEGGELRKELKKKEVGYPGPNVFNGPWN